MTISFQCTGCDRTLKVADDLAGRKAKCPQCKTLLIIPEGPASAISAAPAKKRAAPAARPPAEAPERPRRPARDEADEAPERPRRAARDEADEEAPERPRKKKAKKKRSLLLPLLLAGGGVLLLLCAGGGSFAAWWFLSGGTQDDNYFLPDNTQMVGTVHVNQLLNSGAAQQLRSENEQQFNQGLGQFHDQLGIDLNDITEVHFGAQSFSGGLATQPGAVSVIHTIHAMKAADIQTAMKKNNPTLTFTENKVGRYTVYDAQASNPAPGGLRPLQNPSQAMSFVMADDKRMVAGPTSVLHSILQRDKKPDLSDKLQAAMKQADFTATIAFAANAKDAFPKQGPAPAPGGINNPFAPPTVSFDKVDGLGVTIKVGADVDVTATAVCQDAASAGELSDGVKKTVGWAKGLLTMYALTGNKVPPEVTELLNVTPQVSGPSVTVAKTIKVAPLIKMAKEQQAAAPAGFPPVRPGK